MLHVVEDVQVVELTGLNYAVDNRTRLGTMNCIDQLPVLFAHTEWPDCAFCGIVVEWNLRIVQEYSKVLLLIQAVVQRFSCC